MRELALFAGAGGGILGGYLLGWRTVCAVEIDPFCRSVLLARQRDGILPHFPIWDDIRTFDGAYWRGHVDVISGGFPCQDISSANVQGAGINGARSGLWREMARVVREVRPRFVFVENSPMLTRRGIDAVLGDLATMGFAARWGVLGTVSAKGPCQRYRIWIVARSHSEHGYSWLGADKPSARRPLRCSHNVERSTCQGGPWLAGEPRLDRMAPGMAAEMDAVRAAGNGQVPAVARLAWEVMT